MDSRILAPFLKLKAKYRNMIPSSQKMKLAIMQPYFMPYIGYFQLLNAVDVFIVYDNIQFTKKGWFHRNRILVNGKDKMLSIPLKKDSDYLNISQRYLADNFDKVKSKILRRITQSYLKAPYYGEVMPIIEKCFEKDTGNMFEFIYNSLKQTVQFLEIETPIIISSEVSIDHSLKSQTKVIAFCKELGADIYINPIGGKSLYDFNSFNKEGIDLKFLQPDSIEYKQFGNDFVPWLSIVDVMMFNPVFKIRKYLNQYLLV